MQGPSSLKRNFDLGVTSRCSRIHGGNHAVDVAVDGRPLRIAEYHDGDSPAFQILLVLDIFIRGKQKVEPASSAAVSNSPFTRVSQPLATASTTV